MTPPKRKQKLLEMNAKLIPENAKKKKKKKSPQDTIHIATL